MEQRQSIDRATAHREVHRPLRRGGAHRLDGARKFGQCATLMARILLIVGGGIAAYKSLELVRLLKKAGHRVTPVLTREASIS